MRKYIILLLFPNLLFAQKELNLIDAIKILHNIENIAFCNFDVHDVVRHQLVKKIVSAYD